MTRTCPDWQSLAAERQDPLTTDPAGWPEALAHFDGCPACRRAAIEADPTLLFRRLPGLALDAVSEAAEVTAMRQAVAAMRTASRLDPARERSVRNQWLRWVAAAALAAASLSLGATHGLPRGPVIAGGPVLTGAVVLPHSAAATPIGPIGTVAPVALSRYSSGQVPMVEELNRPAARVYQMDGGENLSVVMIVDERLDV